MCSVSSNWPKPPLASRECTVRSACGSATTHTRVRSKPSPARLTAAATQGKGMTWTPEQAAWALARPEVRGERQEFEAMLQGGADPADVGLAFMDKYGLWSKALKSSAPIMQTASAMMAERAE